MRHIKKKKKTAEIVPSKKMDEGRNMAEIKLKKREEMDPAYCWDLSSLFGSDEEFENITEIFGLRDDVEKREKEDFGNKS